MRKVISCAITYFMYARLYVPTRTVLYMDVCHEMHTHARTHDERIWMILSFVRCLQCSKRELNKKKHPLTRYGMPPNIFNFDPHIVVFFSLLRWWVALLFSSFDVLSALPLFSNSVLIFNFFSSAKAKANIFQNELTYI